MLAERVDSAVIVGVGLNVASRTEELPVETATSLVIENAACGRPGPALRAVLREIETHYRDWSEAHGDADACGLRAAYLAISATIGREVRVELPGERVLTGWPPASTSPVACWSSQGEEHTLSAGDVVHVRPHTS